VIAVEADVSEEWDSSTDWARLAEAAVRAAVAQSGVAGLLESGLTAEVSVRFTSDEEVRSLNAAWRGKDKATNVLSFPMAEPEQLEALARADDGEALLGDIVLAHGVCAREAADKDMTIPDHASHLVVHGALHLLGYDHEQSDEDADAMETLEREALARLGIADPYSTEVRSRSDAEDDDDDSQRDPSPPSFWRGLRTFLFGEESEATLREEIEEAIESHEGEVPAVGDLSPIERQMLRNLLHFGESTVADIAVTRGDIIAIPSTIGFPELVAAFVEAGHSRLPVYEESLDSVIGMAHIKDVFTVEVSGAEPPQEITGLLRKPLYVPESMGVLDLLARMRAERVHLAIVVDEFGGTEGLVTIEDVVEEIVGEIEDEHDEEAPGMLIALEDGIWDADARAELEDVAEMIDARLGAVEEDVDTLGGLATVLAGHVPQAGEIVEHPSGWRLEITESDTRRVTRLRLHAPQEGAMSE
jgi:rRNA maturation RNase YbeY